jgi:tetrahydromethanopterin:alpha-L-glutamate ligase
MTHLVALVSGSGWHVADLRRAAETLDIRFQAVPFQRVSALVREGGQRVVADDVTLTEVDGVLVRMMPPGSLEQVVFRMDALHRVSAAGIPVWNPPRAVEAAVDKFLTLALLDQAGIPVPPTWTGQSADLALTAFEALGEDVVVKPLFGSEGRGLVRISDREVAWRTFHALERIGSVLYLQRMLHHPGHDLRVFVLQGRVLGAMRRFASANEWRTNVSLGGHAEPVRPDQEAEHLALAASRAVGTEMAGVDLVEDLDQGRLVVLEVNAVPGWRALSRVTGIDVAGAVLSGLRECRR